MIHHLGQQTVLRGDNLDLMRSIRSRSFDLVVTSPPYNFGVKYGVYQDNLPPAEFFARLELAFTNIRRLMKDEGSFFLVVGSKPLMPWRAFEIAELAGRYFALQNTIVWVKSVAIGRQTFGGNRPITSDRYLTSNFELVLHLTKTGQVQVDRGAIAVSATKVRNVTHYGMRPNERCLGNVWFVPNEYAGKRTHPAPFPAELVEKCIKLHGIRPDMRLLDPWAGEGNALVACERLGVRGVGIEIDPTYVERAKEKIGGAAA